MQNEELTKELNALQEKFNKEIEDVKKKYEKKEKTLDELAVDISKLYYPSSIQTYFKENKQEVINILNNL